MTDERYEQALEILEQLQGAETAATMREGLESASRSYAEYAMSAAYGTVYARGVLGLRDRELITVAVLAAMGGCEPQLKRHVAAALNVGLSPAEVVETIIHVTAYAGAPRGTNAIHAAAAVFAERGIETP